MKPNKILILALAGLMLAVVGMGNAFAWSGTEASYCNNANYAAWSQQIGGSNNVGTSSWYTFGPNTFTNSYSQTLYMTLYGSDGRSGSSSQVYKGSLAVGSTSPQYTSGSIQAPSSTGWDYVFVQHYYGLTPGAWDIWVNPAGNLDLNIV